MGVRVVIGIEGTSRSELQAEQFEVAVARDAGSPEVILDNKHRYGCVLGNNYRSDEARLSEHHVIALNADATKAFENLDELLIRYRAKL